MEVALIKLCKPAMETNYDSILDRIRVLEKQLEDGVVVAKDAGNSNGVGNAALSEDVVLYDKEEVASYPAAVPEELQEVARNWNSILLGLPKAVSSMMGSAKPTVGEGNSLLLVFTDSLEEDFVNREHHLRDIESVIRFQIQREVKVTTRYVSPEKKPTDTTIDLRKIVKNITIEYED